MVQDYSVLHYSISPSAAPSVDNNSIGKTDSNENGNLSFNGPQGHTDTAGGILRLLSVVGLWTFIFVCALYFKWEESRSSRRRRPLNIQSDAQAPSALTEEELSQETIFITKLLDCTSKIVEAEDLVPDHDANISGSCRLTEKETSESDLSSAPQSCRSIDIEQGEDKSQSSLPVVTVLNVSNEISVEDVSQNGGTATQLKLPPLPFQDPLLSKVKPHFVAGQCAICLLPYQQNDQVTWSPNSDVCSHAFHTNCIAAWLARQQRQPNENPKCPCCRNDFLILPQEQ